MEQLILKKKTQSLAYIEMIISEKMGDSAHKEGF